METRSERKVLGRKLGSKVSRGFGAWGIMVVAQKKSQLQWGTCVVWNRAFCVLSSVTPNHCELSNSDILQDAISLLSWIPEIGPAKNNPRMLTTLGCPGTPDPRNSSVDQFLSWGIPRLKAPYKPGIVTLNSSIPPFRDSSAQEVIDRLRNSFGQVFRGWTDVTEC